MVPIYQLPPQLAELAQGPSSDPLNPLLREVGWNYHRHHGVELRAKEKGDG